MTKIIKNLLLTVISASLVGCSTPNETHNVDKLNQNTNIKKVEETASKTLNDIDALRYVIDTFNENYKTFLENDEVYKVEIESSTTSLNTEFLGQPAKILAETNETLYLSHNDFHVISNKRKQIYQGFVDGDSITFDEEVTSDFTIQREVVISMNDYICYVSFNQKLIDNFTGEFEEAINQAKLNLKEDDEYSPFLFEFLGYISAYYLFENTFGIFGMMDTDRYEMLTGINDGVIRTLDEESYKEEFEGYVKHSNYGNDITNYINWSLTSSADNLFDGFNSSFHQDGKEFDEEVYKSDTKMSINKASEEEINQFLGNIDFNIEEGKQTEGAFEFIMLFLYGGLSYNGISRVQFDLNYENMFDDMIFSGGIM